MQPLGEVAHHVTVGHVGSMRSEYVTAGIPFLRSKNVREHRIELDDLVFIGPEFHHRLQKSALKPGDVVVVRTGVPGTAAVIPETLSEANCADLVIIRPGPRLDPWFLSYYLNGVAHHQINSRVVGAVQQHFNVTSAKELLVPAIPREVQAKVITPLRLVDQRIELNCHTNRTIEALVESLFRSWFVDFDPVVAKVDGREPLGMDAEIAALFPDAFTDSELGPVPEGWEVVPFASGVTIESGGTPRTNVEEYWDGPIPWFSVVDTPSGSDVFVTSTQRTITQTGIDASATRIVPSGTTILTARGTVGNLAMTGQPMAFNQSCYGLVSSTPAYTYLATKEAVASLQRLSHGSVFSTITRRTLAAYRTVAPSPPVQEAFEEVCWPLLARILVNVHQNQSLTSLRELLLPKLLSGEIRIEEAEELLGIA